MALLFLGCKHNVVVVPGSLNPFRTTFFEDQGVKEDDFGLLS